MMRMLLVNPSVGEGGSTGYFPLGLGYIASILLAAHHDVYVLDLNAQSMSESELEAYFAQNDFDLIGMTSYLIGYEPLRWLVSLIKEACDGKLVIGGGLATAYPELLLEKVGVDICITHEGEETILDIVNCLEGKGKLTDVKGIWFLLDGQPYFTRKRKAIYNLDGILFPAWDLFDMDFYLSGKIFGSGHSRRSMNMISSRGCPYRCIFCDNSILGRKFRRRSPQNMVAEIEELKRRYDIQHVAFNDDTFVLDKKRIHKFCELLISKDLDISWMCNGRIELMTEELLSKMKEAGCNTIAYGIESGSQKILDHLKKGFTVEQTIEAINLTRKVGINVHPYLMIGAPGETEETIRETIEFCKEMKLSSRFHICTPIKGAPLYSMARASGLIPDDEEELLENYRQWSNITVNMTDFSDEQLLRLKREAEAEIYNAIVGKRSASTKSMKGDFRRAGISRFSEDGKKYIMDISTGALFLVDDIVYDIIDSVRHLPDDEIINSLSKKYGQESVAEALSQLKELEEEGYFR